jgi:adenylate cyclase
VDGQKTHFLGSAYLVAGKFEAAAVLFKERIQLSPKTDLPRFSCRSTRRIGRPRKAAACCELTEINPKYSFAEQSDGFRSATRSTSVDPLAEGLSKAGIRA